MAVPCSRPVGLSNSSRVCEVPKLVPGILRSLDTSVARRVLSSYIGDRHLDLVDIKIDPNTYQNADLFWRDWLAVNILSKFPNLNLGINTVEVALGKFMEGEAQCLQSNRRLNARYATPTLGVSGESLISEARLKIARLLGDFDWDDAEPMFGFSSGASTRMRRATGDAYHKFQGKPDVTRNAALLAVCAIWSSPVWRTSMQEQFGLDPMTWVNVVQGSRITTVPKNAKTDRTIAIEPCMNMYLQRGIGGLIRKRLKSVGVNLDSQELNQEYARLGSIDGSLATIDLRAASDTISIEIVRALLPPDWFRELDRIRCEHGELADGRLVTFQKFSSMGNGFTFELESLIFWALSSVVTDSYAGSDRRLAVYGDDIIVPSAAAGFLVELLVHCGFETNVDKSFFSGPFRESCGKHYFNGVDVTPFYIKDPIVSLSRQFWLANSLRRWASRPLDGQIADPRYHKAWLRVVDTIKPRNRFYIPEGIGDGGLIGTFVEARPSRTRSMWKVSYLYETLGKRLPVNGVPACLRAYCVLRRRTRDTVVDGLLDSIIVNRDMVKTRVRPMFLSRWDDAGLWPVSLELSL